jgi:phage replication initiation protein
MTVEIGKRVSDLFVRIYDKAAEQGISGQWVRVEIEAKRERARALVALVACDGLSAVASILRGYVDFKLPSGADSNKRRWETAPWWDQFLRGVGEQRLTMAPRGPRTVAQVAASIEHQYGPWLAVLAALEDGQELVAGILERGPRRWKAEHVSALREAVGA